MNWGDYTPGPWKTASELDRERFRSLAIVKCASTRKNIERKLEG